MVVSMVTPALAHHRSACRGVVWRFWSSAQYSKLYLCLQSLPYYVAPDIFLRIFRSKTSKGFLSLWIELTFVIHISFIKKAFWFVVKKFCLQTFYYVIVTLLSKDDSYFCCYFGFNLCCYLWWVPGILNSGIMSNCSLDPTNWRFAQHIATIYFVLSALMVFRSWL